MALKFRTIDGSNNNLTDPEMNKAGADFAGWGQRISPTDSMQPGPNPRAISNIVSAQTETAEDGPHLIDDNGVALSGMMYAWGQFIDLDLEKSGATTDISIQSRLMINSCRHAQSSRWARCPAARPRIRCYGRL